MKLCMKKNHLKAVKLNILLHINSKEEKIKLLLPKGTIQKLQQVKFITRILMN